MRSFITTVCRTPLLAAALACASLAQVTPYTGNVGGPGGPFDVLFINGSAGGGDRIVEAGLGDSITFDMVPAGTVTPGSVFVLFAYLGEPGPGDVTTLPFGIGDSAFPFCPLVGANPLLVTLVDPFGLGCPPLLPGTPAPWTFTFPPVGIPVSATLQGVILDPAGVSGFSVTNAVTLRVVDDRIQALYTKIAGHPTAVVPGAVDLTGNPAVTEFRAFEMLVGSPDGTNWMLRGRTQQGTASETMMMTGGGATGSVFAQKGRPVHGGAPNEIYDFFGSGLGRFNDTNDFIYSARAAGGPTGTLQKVIRVVGGVGTIVGAEGGPLGGLVDLLPAPSGDELIGNSVGSAHLLNTLAFGTQDSTITQIHTSRRPAIFYSSSAFHQTGVTTVLGLDLVTPQTWATIDANAFYTTPDGLHWVATGRITGQTTTTDGVLVVDGAVRMQEGNVIPGGTITPSTFLNVSLSGNGHWYARGAQVSTGVYAARDGVVVAKTGDPIVAASSETWGTSYSAFTGNRNGDWVVFGATNASTATDNVVVLNGTEVVLREGDPVDLDGNGLFDDDVFIGRGNDTLTAFSADNAFLTDDLVLYMFISLRNGAGVDLNSNPVFSTPLAMLRVKIPSN